MLSTYLKPKRKIKKWLFKCHSVFDSSPGLNISVLVLGAKVTPLERST